MKLTFKKHIATGRYRSFESESHEIKLKGKMIGHISEVSGRWTSGDDPDVGKFKVSLAIKKEVTDEDLSEFKWVYLKKRFDNAKEAREWLNEHIDSIASKHDIHQFEK
jgi:hypothetical protein